MLTFVVTISWFCQKMLTSFILNFCQIMLTFVVTISWFCQKKNMEHLEKMKMRFFVNFQTLWIWWCHHFSKCYGVFLSVICGFSIYEPQLSIKTFFEGLIATETIVHPISWIFDNTLWWNRQFFMVKVEKILIFHAISSASSELSSILYSSFLSCSNVITTGFLHKKSR